MPYKPPNVIKGSVKIHGDIFSQIDQRVLNVSNIYSKINRDEDVNPAWRYSGSPHLQEKGTIRRATSFDDLNRPRKLPNIKLPPISNSDLGENNNRQDKRTRNRFAIGYADKGLLYKTNLSTSMPDMPSLSKPKGKPVKFEKLSYSKRITEGENAPAPAGNRPVVIPSPTPMKLPPIKPDYHGKPFNKHGKRQDNRFPNADVFNIVNTTTRSVEYYEHDGHIYVSDNNQSWKEDCPCKICRRNKREYFDSKRKLEEKRMRKMKNTLTLRGHASPVKEVNED